MTLPSLQPHALAQLAAVTDGAIRVGPIQGLPALLGGLGQDPEVAFREAGVDPGLLDDPENLIDFTALGRLMDRCAMASGVPAWACSWDSEPGSMPRRASALTLASQGSATSRLRGCE